MKQAQFYLVLLIGFVTLFACKNDPKSIEGKSEENVEEIAEDIIEKELVIEEEQEETENVEGAVQNEVEVELEEVNIDKEAVIAQKKEILKEQLKESPNLGKDCESILAEYEKLVDTYISGNDQAMVLKQLADWANDPIYNKCKKDDAFKDKFFELEEKMYADEDEDF